MGLALPSIRIRQRRALPYRTSDAPEWGAWQAVFGCCPAPWPVASRGDSFRCSFNPVVGHTRKRVCKCGSGKIFIHERGPLTDTRESLNHSRRGRYSEGLGASRDARAFEMMGSWAAPDRGVVGGRLSFGRHGGRRGRIGVVKLLRARGGCLGVIRWRAWKAAKGPGELPNERRSRNTRWIRGELKHLSTRRKRNQPRLPQ